MKASWIVAAVAMTASVAFGPQCAFAKSVSGQERAEDVGRQLVGSVAPSFTLKTIDGRKIDLAKFYGRKAVYLKFWATWCIPCREQMPHFEHLYETAGSDLAVIAVDVGFNESLEEVQAVRQSERLTMPIVIDDGSLGRAFHLRVTPQHVVIGRNGLIQYVGHLADQRLDDALVAARTTGNPAPRSHGATAASDMPRYRLGDRLPDISATTIDGQTFRARQIQGRHPTVLVFIEDSCESYLKSTRPERSESCRQVREQVDALARNHDDVRWIGIASGLWTTRDDLIEYQNQYKPGIPLTLDESGDLFRSFRVMNVPTVLIAEPRGRIVYRHEGFDSRLSSELRSVQK